MHEPALNHVGLWIDDLPGAVAWLEAKGVRFTPGGIRKGATGHDVCFIHPKGNDAAPVGGSLWNRLTAGRPVAGDIRSVVQFVITAGVMSLVSSLIGATTLLSFALAPADLVFVHSPADLAWDAGVVLQGLGAKLRVLG